MDEYLSMKMKRKELEEVYDDFSEFSLSSPARKIRRLDAELPPIMEEEEPSGVSFNFDQVLPEQQPLNEETLALVPNEERALILYKPMNTPLQISPSSKEFSITVNSDLIPGLKDQGFWRANNRDLINVVKREEEQRKSGECMELIPWVESQFPRTLEGSDVGGVGCGELLEPMEAEEQVDDAGMEIEFDNNNNVGWAHEGQGQVLQQQQQHCMTPPELPQTTPCPIPVMWYR